ncbi:protocadherin Fat 1-like isoform X2 [Crassostrea virginica]
MKAEALIWFLKLLFFDLAHGARVPSFSPDVAVVNIQEGQTDTHVITLNCTTPSGSSCDLTIGDGFNNTFLLVNNDIRTAVSPPVDYEALGDRNFVVTLEVHGRDPTDPSSNHTAVATVFVYVGPVNEFQPIFVGVPYTAQVPEDIRVGNQVIQLTGKDGDLGPQGEITFSIVAGNNDNKFQINPKTGRIFTADSLDYETVMSYRLTVRLSDGDNTTEEDVTISVLPVNDNDPQCTPTVYHVTMGDEFATEQTKLQTLSCTDADGDALTYTIVSGNTGGDFDVTPTGTIVLTKDLDATRNPLNYLLTIEVTDGERSTDALFRIYVIKNNTKAPEFLSEQRDVPESKAVGSEIIVYTAYDPDQPPYGIVSYEIQMVTNGGDNQFLIERNTGRIKLARPLDYESVTSYNIIVVSTDGGGLKGTGTVAIDVLNENDNVPVCRTYAEVYNVREDTAVNTVISTDVQCTDADNNQLTYNLVMSPPGSTFDVTDFGHVFLKEPLDFEAQSFYEFDVIVSDGGSSPVKITMVIDVINVNEHPPIFSPEIYHSTLDETSQPGVNVTMVTASDGDLDTLSYSFLSPAPEFNLGSSSGLIILSQALNAETQTSYTLQVIASDGDKTATATVSVTVRDVNEAPAFDQDNYSFSNIENTPTGTLIGKVVAKDPDVVGNNAVFRYSIISGNVNSHFLIDPDDGTLSVAVPVDFEVTRSVLLVIEVSDFGSIPLSDKCTVNISIQDVNDNPPEFATATLTEFLPEDAGVGDVVSRVSAKDIDSDRNDNNLFLFRIQQNVPFVVDPRSGNVSVKEPLDRELQESYEMVIEAEDGGFPPNTGSVTLTVILTDVNDNAPLILGTYDKTIPENEPIHSLVFTMSASDIDAGDNGRFLYSIIAGNPGFHFRIEQITGYVQVSTELDRESQSVYELVIQATDLGSTPRSSTVTATVTLSDVNDMAPNFNQGEYSFNVQENVPRGTSVGTVGAKDEDLGANAFVIYRIKTYLEGHAGKFTIDPSTGALSTLGDLDREVEGFYSIKVIAEDRGSLWSEALVNVTVTDANDNAPMFTRTQYSTEVFEDLAVSTVILTVTAHDRDLGTNALIGYSIDPNSRDGVRAGEYFSLNGATGVLRLIKELDREFFANISMTVIATDAGAQQQSSNTTVSVFIEDINDNRPVFQPSFYNAEVSYEHACDHIITVVTAMDVDQEKNAEVVYEMDPVYGENQFILDPISGQIKTNLNVNESINVILVRAHDLGTPRLMTSLSAKIRIDSFNASETILLFSLSMNLPTYLKREAEFLSLVKETIAEFYATAYVRRWCIEDKTTSVVVYVYAVKNDLTKWESNLNLDKPFMTNGEFLDALELNQNNIPTINGTDERWRDLLVTDVGSYGDDIVYPAGSSRASGDAGSSGLVIALATIFSILALVLLVALILCLLWRRKLKKRKENNKASSTPKLIKVQSKISKNGDQSGSSEKRPFIHDEDEFGGSVRHVTNVANPSMVYPNGAKVMGSPLTRSGHGKGSPTGSALDTDKDTDSLTKIDIDGRRDKLVSPSGVKSRLTGSPSTGSVKRRVLVEKGSNLAEDGDERPSSDGRASTRTYKNRGIDPVTGWVYEDNPEQNGRQWLKTPDGDPIFEPAFI